jgi:hypothetical protein
MRIIFTNVTMMTSALDNNQSSDDIHLLVDANYFSTPIENGIHNYLIGQKVRINRDGGIKKKSAIFGCGSFVCH